MNDTLKKFLIDIVKEIGSELLFDTKKTEPVVTPMKEKEIEPSEPSPGGSVINVSDRFYKLSPTLYYCRNIITTVFCNEADFTESTYKLATNSEYNIFHKGKMKDVRGVSLPYPIDRNRIVYPINPKNGLMLGYGQVDVGPGWTKDGYWISGTAPKNEGGVDFRGNRSVKAGLDLLPQVCEDLELCSFDQAYNTGWSGVLDMIVYEPIKATESKVIGHESPSSDTRSWVRDLPFTGSEFFSWKELLRGWNLATRPSNEQIQNLVKLTTEFLHPVRKKFGRIDLGSGLRDLNTNSRVGGRDNSFHLVGRSADLVPQDRNFTEVYEWCKVNMKDKIRELVLEDVGTPNAHVHVTAPILPGENQNIRIK